MLEKYFFIPVFLLKNLVTAPNDTLNNMISYGLYDFSQKFNYNGRDIWPLDKDLHNATLQVIYAYHRNKQIIPISLLSKLENYYSECILTEDEDSGGFNCRGEFEPLDDLIDEYYNVYTNDEPFKNQVLEFGRMKTIYSLMNVSSNGKTMKRTIETGKNISSMIREKEPMVMVNRDKVFEFRDEQKTEFELMTFAVYLGIRSILGTKQYCNTNKEMIYARAFGYRNFAELQQNKPVLFDKYIKRYQRDKIFNEIKLGNWNIHIYTANGIRGIYVANKKITLKDFITKVENKRKSKQEADYNKKVKVIVANLNS
ncbi:MAG: hypothetical protein VB024_04510 [Dysgonamonadaceae bacterium]|nr:hypothetical protein [Dysgonamonadaceae bacterium]